MRFDSVSMSPSVRSACATWRGEPVGRDRALPHQEAIEGRRPARHGWPARSCGSREPGRPPTTARPRRASVASARTSSSRAACSSTRMSSATGARVRPLSVGVSASDACSAPSEAKSSSVLRHCSILIGSNEWLSSACTSSVSNGGQRPVVPKVPSRVARPARPAICAELGRIELAELIAVELAVGGEGDVIDVEIEAHADRVGGDQIVDVAGLVERDLRVARARRQRAEHDRGAAALAADQFGDGIDLVGRERDDRGAARQPRDLLLAREGELRQPRPRQHMGARQQPLDHRPHGRGAEHQRLLAAAAVEHAVGEDVAALEIGAELHLVDRDEGDIEIARHRLDGGDPEARIRRLDLLLAGDQRDLVGARPGRRPCCRPRAPAAAAAARSCRTNGRACARWRDGSCRCWSARARR